MTKQDIREMMRDISPEFQQKADKRALAAQRCTRRSMMPSLMIGGAATACAALAAVILLPPLHREMTAASLQDDSAQESTLESEIIEIPAVAAPITDFSGDTIRLMAPAYAPYMLDISAEQQKALADALMQSEWIPYDINAPYGDSECYSVFVYNGGDSYSLVSYADHTVVMEQNGGKTRWKIFEDAERAIAEAANPKMPTDQNAASPLTNHLTWCSTDSINAKDIWKNTRIGAKECDMTKKEDIFFKMNNTADYFDRCSGTVKTGNVQSMTKYDFQVDLNTATAYQHEENYNGPSAEALMAEEGLTDAHFSVTTAMDGDSLYDVSDLSNGQWMKYPGVTHRIDSPTVAFEDLHSTDPTGTEYDYWNSRKQLLRGISVDCIENYRMAVDYLQDFSKWEIIGNDQVNGRLCVQIEGTLDYEYDMTKRFVLFVDEQTGVTVRMLGFDVNDTLIRFIDVENLAFDDDAAPVTQLDFASLNAVEAVYNLPVGSPAEDETRAEEALADSDMPVQQPAADQPVTEPTDNPATIEIPEEAQTDR